MNDYFPQMMFYAGKFEELFKIVGIENAMDKSMNDRIEELIMKIKSGFQPVSKGEK